MEVFTLNIFRTKGRRAEELSNRSVQFGEQVTVGSSLSFKNVLKKNSFDLESYKIERKKKFFFRDNKLYSESKKRGKP